MKVLKRIHHYPDKFTVVVEYSDFGEDFDGDWPSIYSYYVFDTEEEMIQAFRDEEDILVSDIETIYFNHQDVTFNYLESIDCEPFTLLPKFNIKEHTRKEDSDGSN